MDEEMKCPDLCGCGAPCSETAHNHLRVGGELLHRCAVHWPSEPMDETTMEAGPYEYRVAVVTSIPDDGTARWLTSESAEGWDLVAYVQHRTSPRAILRRALRAHMETDS